MKSAKSICVFSFMIMRCDLICYLIDDQKKQNVRDIVKQKTSYDYSITKPPDDWLLSNKLLK